MLWLCVEVNKFKSNYNSTSTIYFQDNNQQYDRQNQILETGSMQKIEVDVIICSQKFNVNILLSVTKIVKPYLHSKVKSKSIGEMKKLFEFEYKCKVVL